MAKQTNIAPGTVFDGRVGTGAAQVLGTPGDPIGAFANQKRMEEARRIAADRERAEREKARNEAFKEMLLVDPEATWQPFNEQVSQAYNKFVRQPTIDAYMSGANPENPLVRTQLDKNLEEVNKIARKGTYIKQTMDEVITRLGEDQFSDLDYYIGAINNEVFQEGTMNPKPYDQIDPRKIQEIANRDLKGFKINDYSDHFVKNIRETVIEQKIKSNQALGIDTDIIQLKSKLYTPDPNNPGEFLRDEDGNYKLNITPDVIQGFEAGHPKAKRFIEEEMARTGDTKENIIAKYVAPHAYKEKTYERSFTTKYPTKSGSESSISDYDIIDETDIDLKDFQDVGKDGVVGMKGVTIPTPNLAKGIQFQDDVLSDVQGFSINSEGKPVINVTSKSATDMKSEVTSAKIPMTQTNLAKIRNSFKKKSDRDAFDGLVKKFNDRINETVPIKVDVPRLNGVVNQIEEQWKLLKESSSNEGPVSSEVARILKQYNIDAEVEADNGMFSDDIKIGGTSYNLDKKDDVEKIKTMLFNASKPAFTKYGDEESDVAPQEQTETYPDNVEQGIEAFMKANGISREEAVKVLKENGKI